MALGRGFQEISVTRLGIQTAAQRFGPSHSAPTQLDEDSDSEDEQDSEDSQPIPRIEEWRMNLTVLSQNYNLYFAVYGDKIYVYRPRNPKQALPREPDLILEPPQSRDAVRKNFASRYRGHIINHIVIGNLGDKEILLCSCHDGDVVAYYTQAIENALSDAMVPHVGGVKFFFAENVGESAWALAIHSKSRLIAVGSNAHEIQVFAFALSDSAGNSDPHTHTAATTAACLPPAARDAQFPEVKVEKLLLAHNGKVFRDQSFRLVFSLGAIGHNVPSVAFSDSTDGDAETVIAIDIKGALWFFRLWEDSAKRLPSADEPQDTNRNPIGWGVTVLPRDFFKPTHNLTGTFGWPKTSPVLIARDGMIDITKTVQYVRDSTVWHELYDTDTPDEEEMEEQGDESGSEGEEEEYNGEVDDEYDDNNNQIGLHPFGYQNLEALPNATGHPDGLGQQDIVLNSPQGQAGQVTFTFQQLQTPVGSFPPPYPPSTAGKKITERHNQVLDKKRGDEFQLSRSGEVVLQSFKHNIILHPTQEDAIPTQCDNLLRQEFPHDAMFPRPLTDYNRLNMLATIPELSLVLVASQIGRVALLTITRRVRHNSSLRDFTSMRVDLILPFRDEESKEKIRPSHGLLGIAVGPVQGEKAKMDSRWTGEGPKRWRLMLHYFNHTILSYELSREEETGELLIL